MYVVNEKNVPVSTLVVRGEGWNKWEETPKDNGGGDSSADEEHPANRRHIEVILSQQSLSSDDDNDDAPVLGDLRDVLKRKFESENDSSLKHKDIRTMLDTRKSRRISTSDANNNKGPITDLRDKLNAGACDLRIQLNRSKPTDLRRQLEQAKGHFQPPAHDTNISTDLRTLLDSKRQEIRGHYRSISWLCPDQTLNLRTQQSLVTYAQGALTN
ncbi:hypothetical protein F2Q69_00060364 [Brassica cretica]|uniref:Uncharacterized protein n=1 Tax=Brassica cretica TaxID=69181 RepID=A0A8S9RP71_BRACR|nr:hypothetical protein F2Q69_00060364 [Brassica cretica]